MNTTNTNQREQATPGFACKIEEATELSMAMLVAEDDNGHYLPVAAVCSIREAREMVANDLRNRIRQAGRGEDSFCPASYKIWALGIDGGYTIAAEIEA